MKHCAILLTLALLASTHAQTVRQIRVNDTPGPRGSLTLGGEFPGAKAELTLSDEAAKLDFDLTKGNYIGFVQPVNLPKGTTTLTFKVKPTVPETRFFIRTMDIKGQQHMRRIAGFSKPNQWTTLQTDLSKFEASWGKNEKKVHWPITEIVIGIEINKAKTPIGSFELKDLEVTTTASVKELPNIILNNMSDRFGLLFYPDENPSFKYKLATREKGRSTKFDVTHTVKNWLGETFYTETQKATGEQNLYTCVLTPDKLKNQFGSFQIEITAQNPDDPNDRQSFSLWFGRLQGPNPKPCPFIGVGTHPGHGWGHGDLRLVDIFSAAGIGNVRDEIHWGSVETKKGEYTVPQRGIDYVNKLNERGIRFNYCMTYDNKLYENPCDPHGFANFAAYMGNFFKDKNITFEIWNEAYNFHFGKRYPGVTDGYPNWVRKFVELSLEAKRAIRKVNPNADIAVCAEDVERSLIMQIELGIADDPRDIISFHPYCHGQPRPEREMFLKDNGTKIRQLCEKHGGAKRFIITEAGWTTYSGEMEYLAIAGGYPRSSYVHQAQYLIRMYLTAIASGVEYACQYDFKNDGSNRSYTEHNFGIVHQDYSPKPSLLAIAHLTRLLEDATFVENLAQDPRQFSLYHFKDKNKRDLVAAYVINGEKSFEFPCASDVKIIDLQGNPIKPTIKNGKLAITLTEIPVYIYGLDLNNISQHARLELIQKSSQTLIGDLITFQVNLTNRIGKTAEKATASYTFNPTPKEFKPITWDLTTNLPNKATFTTLLAAKLDAQNWSELNGKNVELIVTCDVDGITAESKLVFQPSMPIIANANAIIRKNNQLKIPITFNNTARRRGAIEIEPISEQIKNLKKASFELNGDECQVVYLNIEGNTIPDNPTLTLNAKLSSGWQHTFTSQLANAIIPKAPAKIPLAMKPATFSVPDNNPLPYNTNDLDAKAFVSQSQKGIILEIQVFDDNFFQPYSNQNTLWAGDSIQVSLTSEGSQNHLAIMAASVQGKPKLIVENKILNDVSHDGIAFNCKNLDKNTILYTVEIPWNVLPKLDGIVRLSALVNDNDGNGRKSYTQFHGGIGKDKNIAEFGTYSLE